MNEKDKQEALSRYINRFKEFGYSEKTLGWTKNKAQIRFEHLISEWNQELISAEIADFGCGFGDFYDFLRGTLGYDKFNYTGIDINPVLINEGGKRFENAAFWVGDICVDNINKEFDFVFSSGVFNHKLSGENEYDFIWDNLLALNKMTRKGMALNFLSENADVKYDHCFYASPTKILDMAYKLSKNVILKNDCMPFEFSIFIRKDKMIDMEKVIYIQ
jgi:SAM-dependent methyltransferase